MVTHMATRRSYYDVFVAYDFDNTTHLEYMFCFYE